MIGNLAYIYKHYFLQITQDDSLIRHIFAQRLPDYLQQIVVTLEQYASLADAFMEFWAYFSNYFSNGGKFARVEIE